VDRDRLFPLPAEKRCSTCRELKPLSEFNRYRKAPDGHQWSCRECNRRYHYANLDRHMARIRQRRQEVTERNQRLVLEYLADHPCADCGESDPIVLEFDHLRDKRANISALTRNGESWRLLEEIAKCEVRCANCHRRITAIRGGWYRTRS
jgi:hypothetical protein